MDGIDFTFIECLVGARNPAEWALLSGHTGIAEGYGH
jgi:hypothetical protein